MNEQARQLHTQALADVCARLARALGDEQLVSPPPSTADLQDMLSRGPCTWLREAAAQGRITETTPNLERALAELSDGINGLSRARRGIAQRFSHSAPAHSDPWTALVHELRQRNVQLGFNPHSASALLARFEQLVCDGHPRHPAAKTSLGLGDAWADVLPEQVETIACRFLAVERRRVARTGEDMHAALARELPALWNQLERELTRRGIGETHAVIPVHPWQLQHVIRAEFAAELDCGIMHELDTSARAEPLMSVRTVRISDGRGAAHLKLAIEAQLTGAIRGISTSAMYGPTISRALHEALGIDAGISPRTSEDAPSLNIGEDLAGISYALHPGDSALRGHCLGAILRRDPAATLGPARTDDDVLLPVAALSSRNPLSGQTILADILHSLSVNSGGEEASIRALDSDILEGWFTRLAEVLAAPAIALMARWGVAMEPHPQNTVLVLRNGVPHACLIRDFGGCRILSPTAGYGCPIVELPTRGVSRLVERISDTALLSDNLPQLIHKLTYPLLSNLWAGLVECLENTPETKSLEISALAWRSLARVLESESRRMRFARSSRSEVGYSALIDATYQHIVAATLPLKRVWAMRLKNSVTDQEYVDIPNPLHQHRAALRAEAAAHRAEEYPRAEAEVARRWEDSCRIEGAEWSQETLPGGLVDDHAQAARILADTRCTVRERAARLAQRCRLQGMTDTPSYWDLVGLYPRGLIPAVVDSLSSEGHTVHPLAKLRRGFEPEESAVYGPENLQPVELRLVCVDSRLLEHAAHGSVEASIESCYPRHAELAREELRRHSPDLVVGGELIVMHPWQWEHVVSTDFAHYVRSNQIRLISSCTLTALPTISLRTLLPLAPDARGQRPMIKTSLEIQLTSTRRSISRQSALGSPSVAAAIQHRTPTLIAGELTGTALRECDDSGEETQEFPSTRSLSTLWRTDPLSLIDQDAVAVSACALLGQPPKGPGSQHTRVPAPLQGFARDCSAAQGFVRAYARDVFSTTLPLMWRHGIALESHLQNTMIVLGRGSQPDYRGIVLRDVAGVRIYAPRYQAEGAALPTQPGAITVTTNQQEFLNKGYYATIYANLAGIIHELTALNSDLRAPTLWAVVREEIETIISGYGADLIPEADLEYLHAPAMRQKAFARMALHPQAGDIYIEVPNPVYPPQNDHNERITADV